MKKLSSFIFLSAFLLSFYATASNKNGGSNDTSTTMKDTAAGVSIDSSDSAEQTYTYIIAHINGDKVSFVADSNKLRDDWEKYLNAQLDSNHCVLGDVQISFDRDSSKYYLITTGARDKKILGSLVYLRQHGSCLFLSGFTAMETTANYKNNPHSCIRVGPCTRDTTFRYMSTTTWYPTALFPSMKRGSCE